METNFSHEVHIRSLHFTDKHYEQPKTVINKTMFYFATSNNGILFYFSFVVHTSSNFNWVDSAYYFIGGLQTWTCFYMLLTHRGALCLVCSSLASSDTLREEERTSNQTLRNISW